jgi:hypothetical protein
MLSLVAAKLNRNQMKTFHLISRRLYQIHHCLPSTYVKPSHPYIGQIAGIFTHHRGGTRRMFIVLDVVHGTFKKRGIIENARDPSEDADAILLAPTITVSDERLVVGLPGINALPIGVTPTKEPNTFWFINQDIYYL